MKRVGIMTLYHNNTNYGGMLQAYALCRTVESMGCSCRIIDYVQRPLPLAEKLRRRVAADGLRRTTAYAVTEAGRKFREKGMRICCGRVPEEVKERERHVAEFRAGIPHTDPYTAEELAEAAEQFDLILSGSDQIWNLGGAGQFDPAYWLDFVPEGKEKAAYAASMPIPEIPGSQVGLVREWVRGLDCVSVREEQGRRLLEPLRGAPVPVVLDPVFLPEMKVWEKLSGGPLFRKPYLYAYFLGRDREKRKAAEEFAHLAGLQLVTTSFLTPGCYADRKFGDVRMCGGPEEFLNLIRYASFVLTDSFHAAVFAVLFQRPFRVFRRKEGDRSRNMDERIITLLEKTGMPECLTEPRDLAEALCGADRIPDHQKAGQIICRERELSLAYLRAVLEGGKKEGADR